jgi:hypothetical protein
MLFVLQPKVQPPKGHVVCFATKSTTLPEVWTKNFHLANVVRLKTMTLK